MKDVENNAVLRAAIRSVITRGQLVDDPAQVDLLARYVEAAARLYPDDVRLVSNAWMTEGLMRRRLGDLATARELFERVRSTYPGSVSYGSWAAFELGRTAAIAGDLEGAGRILRGIAAAYPEHHSYCSKALAVEAVHRMLAHQPAVARRRLMLTVERYPDDKIAVEVKQAVEGAPPAGVRVPRFAGAPEMLRGLLCLVDGDVEQGRDWLERSLELADRSDDSSFPRWEATALLNTLG